MLAKNPSSCCEGKLPSLPFFSSESTNAANVYYSFNLFEKKYQCGGLMDKTMGLGVRWGIKVRILGRGECSVRTIPVDARVKYSLIFKQVWVGFSSKFSNDFDQLIV